MAEKYLRLDTNGNIAENEAITASSGSADAGKIVALNDEGKIDETMLPDTISPEVLAVTAGEDLNAGDIVYIYDDSGTIKARKAIATDASKAAIGFVKESAATDGEVKVYFEGVISGLSSLVVGKCYFLSDTNAGQVQDNPPTVSGHYVQRVGSAISTTELQFERSQPIIRA